MKIRAYRAEDASRLEEIFRRAVHEIGIDFYTDEQVSAWGGPRVTAAHLHRKYADGRATFIAEDRAGAAIAFSDLEADGHVDMLYCHPDYARKGIASALLEAVERTARASGIERLYTEASDAARPVFERAGYTVLSRQDLDIDGVALHNWKMEKRF
ncbi:GNAT family N-acetyltransferase [Henriciella aquimarina]|uniref:GNAT family N-acetyltransferase n=1 Tax=Henriciella aquimarina TaxID=545261 RepID=UPI000A03D2EF|nr:GNAT family N-acetyltransferase [Henriciella aquimarina]